MEGEARKEAYTASNINIISQRHYVVARLIFFVVDVRGLRVIYVHFLYARNVVT